MTAVARRKSGRFALDAVRRQRGARHKPRRCQGYESILLDYARLAQSKKNGLSSQPSGEVLPAALPPDGINAEIARFFLRITAAFRTRADTSRDDLSHPVAAAHLGRKIGPEMEVRPHQAWKSLPNVLERARAGAIQLVTLARMPGDAIVLLTSRRHRRSSQGQLSHRRCEVCLEGEPMRNSAAISELLDSLVETGSDFTWVPKQLRQLMQKPTLAVVRSAHVLHLRSRSTKRSRRDAKACRVAGAAVCGLEQIPASCSSAPRMWIQINRARARL